MSKSNSKRRGRIRFFMRLGLLATAAVLLLPILPWPTAAMIPPATSPFVAIASAVATRSVAVATIVAVPVLVAVMLRRRWFCRWACPTGFLLEQAGRVPPSLRVKCSKVPPVGRWIVWLSLGGALLGYPVLLWLDPLAIFSGFFSAGRQPAGAIGLLMVAGLPALVAISWLMPNVWCTRFCPLGATQDLVALATQRHHEATESTTGGNQPQVPRRALLSAGVSLAGMGLGAGWAAAMVASARGAEETQIRPPGAVGESQFAGLCVRCGNCIRVCPTGILRPDTQHGLAGLLTPVVDFEKNYCLETCCQCTQVCPSGAIARLALEEKDHASMGIAQVDMEICLLAEDRECSICRRECPYEAVSLIWSDATYTMVVEIDATRCPGCGACEAACPTRPQRAIVVAPQSRSLHAVVRG